MQSTQEGPWRLGINSVDNPCDLPAGQYQWSNNVINKVGTIATRPGLVSFSNITYDAPLHNMTIFTPRDGVPILVTVIGNLIQYLSYPFTGTSAILSETGGGPVIEMNGPTLQFETAVIGVIEDFSGNITVVDPYPILMMCDGAGRCVAWDGISARYLDPDPNGAHETPTCSWMKWTGNRLWTMQGRRIRASNLLNPIKFTEEDILAEGGYFNLPSTGTGFGVTPDFRGLLAFTDFTTTSFQAGLVNRAAWSSTQDFQKVIFSRIGCAAGRSIVNQYGMTWWYSHDGLINLDSALQTYRSSEIKLKDAAMRRSSANFSDDISKICATAFENYLLISVPSGDLHNYHTWIMDSNPSEIIDSSAQWSSIWTGIRPTQWVSTIINGKARCFCSTDDLPPAGSTSLSRGSVWEAFIQDKRDTGTNVGFASVTKNISCGFETRFIPLNLLAAIKYIELDIEEIKGSVQLDIHYSTRRGTYKRFGTKHIIGTIGSVTAAMTLPITFSQYLPQKRTVKSVNECLLSTDTNPSVETQQTINIDKYFSILVKWTGQMSISKIRLYFDEAVEQRDGVSESNETTDRYIRPTGDGAILSTGPTALPVTPQQSGFITTVSPRWIEEIYASNT